MLRRRTGQTSWRKTRDDSMPTGMLIKNLSKRARGNGKKTISSLTAFSIKSDAAYRVYRRVPAKTPRCHERINNRLDEKVRAINTAG